MFDGTAPRDLYFDGQTEHHKKGASFYAVIQSAIRFPLFDSKKLLLLRMENFRRNGTHVPVISLCDLPLSIVLL